MGKKKFGKQKNKMPREVLIDVVDLLHVVRHKEECEDRSQEVGVYVDAKDVVEHSSFASRPEGHLVAVYQFVGLQRIRSEVAAYTENVGIEQLDDIDVPEL